MARARIFIDGQAGTTGLRIRELIANHPGVEVLEIDPARRKDPAARAELLNAASVSVLCLPDDAAREAVALIHNPDARVLDASTAYRVAEGWVYGLPELAPDQRDRITRAHRVSNPGCYPTGIVLLLRPLVDAALVPPTAPITVHALSGYTGGGNALIATWEDPQGGLLSLPFEAPYAIERRHKHIPEMVAYARLAADPHFVPAAGPFRCGMRIQIPLHASVLAGVTAARIHEALTARYAGEAFIEVMPLVEGDYDQRSFDPRACNDTNRVRIHVIPNPSGHVLLMATLDNLGKGAAGAAVQCLNLMLGLPEQAGLRA
jgi:N-acetyl-gamma-glutamyl-phosphate reductase